MKLIAEFIDQAFANRNDEIKLAEINRKVIELTRKFPLYKKGV